MDLLSIGYVATFSPKEAMVEPITSYKQDTIETSGDEYVTASMCNSTSTLSGTAFDGERFSEIGWIYISAGNLVAFRIQSSNIRFPLRTPFRMTSSRAALLIGKIAHSRKEWDALSSLVTLKVCASPKSLHLPS